MFTLLIARYSGLLVSMLSSSGVQIARFVAHLVHIAFSGSFGDVKRGAFMSGSGVCGCQKFWYGCSFGPFSLKNSEIR